MKAVDLSQIRTDGGTQPREEIDEAVVAEYAEAMRVRYSAFPPVVVYFDGVDIWLADGFHRYHAAKRIGAQGILAEWRDGSLEEAKLYAASANATHGRRQTPGDKRCAIAMVVATETGQKWTQQQIAEHCHVSQAYVSTVLSEYKTYNSPRIPHRPDVDPPTNTQRKRDAVNAVLAAAPAASDRAIAKAVGVDHKTVGAVRKGQSKAKQGTLPGGASPKPPLGQDVRTPCPTTMKPEVMKPMNKDLKSEALDRAALVREAITFLRRALDGATTEERAQVMKDVDAFLMQQVVQ